MSDEIYEPDSLDIVPSVALQDALKKVQEKDPNKALVILLWDEDLKYSTHFYNAGMKCSEVIALLEIIKSQFTKMVNEAEDAE